MEIVLATLHDAQAILALQHLAYQSEAKIYDDFTLPPLTETLDELIGKFATRRFLKATRDNRIIGSIRAFLDQATCHVERLVVHPDFRRRGLGSELLNLAENLFPDARRFELFTGHLSAGNLRLYERVGYRSFRHERANEKVTLVFLDKTTRVRPYQPRDQEAFRQLNQQWITRYFSLEGKDRQLLDDPEGQILAKGGRIYILERNGEPVGCCALVTRDDETFELAKMAVAEEHRGQGLGRLLLQSCIDRARFAGKRRLFLETNSRLDAAVHLYRKLGFAELPASAWPPAYSRVDLMMQLEL